MLPVSMVPFSKEDKILIKSMYECKGYSTRQFITEFPDKGWTKNSINMLLAKLRKFGTCNFCHFRWCNLGQILNK